MDDQNYRRKKWMFTFSFFLFVCLHICCYSCAAKSSLLCGLFSSSWWAGMSLAAESGLLIALVSLSVAAWAPGHRASVAVTWDLSSCSSWTLENRLNSCGSWLSCCTACGIFLDQWLNTFSMLLNPTIHTK